ncbi:hypothetical protein [Psychroflexus aestuariivivens]|uniref:hypothetical protein n=1 Tax=Psychroflexus aestuariivivens TaxID=1795040 RepID=UPI000FD8FC9E|nr:hypothetical protein [Psychroflexus aestuariivivens]
MKKFIGIFTLLCLIFISACSPETFNDDQYEGQTPEEIFGGGGENKAEVSSADSNKDIEL